MKFISITFVLAALSALSVVASPVKRADVDDTTILQYALTLEHLENAFYSGALAKFDQAAFTEAGLPNWVRGRFAQVASHEASHVALLQKALGDSATKPCKYEFPYTDPKSFVALSQLIEGVGTSAYIGAAKLISNKDYVTVAGSILAVEARHDAWVASSINKGPAWNGPYDTPLSITGVLSLASFLITSCPSTNPTFPVPNLPRIAISPEMPEPGSTVTVTVDDKPPPASHLAFFNGLEVVYAPLKNGLAVVPKELANTGTTYVVVTSVDSGMPSDLQYLSGFEVLDYSASASETY